MKRRMVGRDNGPDENTMLLLHFNNYVQDSTGRNLIIYAPNTFGPGKFDKAIYLNKDVVVIDKSNIRFDIIDWTIDFWYMDHATPIDYRTGLFSNGGGFNWGGNAISIRILSSDGFWRFYFNTPSWNNEKFIDIPYSSITSFTHIAMVKKGSIGRVFFNGILKGKIGGLTTNSDQIENLVIGKWLSGYDSVSQPLVNGYIDEFRISNIARWTSNFIPPTKPY
ncbi:LamG-like jellyroll fold domain-containing protein [uncultured Parabacteroides sp.]|uniref:LamG-like jellyroll fold domain-containing protein n=1 Tax=uncultured Parabacteroides sp. TaxID=512312 RepID=UPI0025FD291C|nr:LamG-like jellyroll fold domain-containing protein [uncultured Parabacteroides sp.]